eukprot:TRINITY_DN2074_c0_g1_i2.p1 TRINITY_DN2074_c0_g1~~TRINITY_DN2074_c0_g1_i2.p1  ORF type:complete len:376 (+),score=85.38 TRINITY_DN2074_c0_g1_i2:114-1241(+)
MSEGRSSLLESIQTYFNNLKPTTTTVTNAPVVDPGNNGSNITGAPTPEEAKEYFETKDDMRAKAVRLAALIRESRHVVIYTGAGISTAASIPDYRGPQGVWTLLAQGKRPTMKITLEQATPTYSHMAIVELLRAGMCKFVVSTNLDGLHVRSGVPLDNIAELHGNIYKEVCDSCKEAHVRMFAVNKSSVRRWTGRLCESCKTGRLRDSIVNFGENLPKKDLRDAAEHSTKADLTIVIGSSMRVTPACDLPSYSYSNGGRFCLVNLQKTGYDDVAKSSGGVRVFARCDEFMRLVMEELAIEVPPFVEEVKDLEKELDNLIPDPSWEGDQVMKKYNVYSMSDDGPPPKSVLRQIRNGMPLKSVQVTERTGVELGKVM